MKRLGRAIDRGLYIVWRDWRDWYAFAWFVVFVAAVFGLGTAIWVTVEEYTAHDWHVFGVYALSEFLLFLPFAPDKTKKIRDLDGEILVWTIDAITRHSGILDLRDRLLGEALGAGLWGGGAGVGLLMGVVVALRVFYWRRSRQRRRVAGAKRAASVPRRRIGHRFDRIPCLLRASGRFVWKTAKRCARSGNVEREDARSTVGKRRVVDGAASGSERRRRSSAVPWAIGKPTLRLSESARSVRRGRADAGDAPPGQGHLHSDRRPDGEVHDDSSSPRLPAASPPVPTASPPAVLDDSDNPNQFDLSSCLPLVPERVSHLARASDAEGGASPKPGPSQERPAAARDAGSGSDPPATLRGGHGAPDDRLPGSNERPPGTRPGARRRRRKASQDFY